MDGIVRGAEDAARKQHMRTLYGLTKVLSNKRSRSSTVILDVGFSIPWNDDAKYETVYSFILQQISTSKYPKYI